MTTIILLFSLVFATIFQEKSMVHIEVMELYKPESAMETATEEWSFWQQKLYVEPGNPLYLSNLARSHQNLFDLTGQIDHLVQARLNLIKSLGANPLDLAPTFRELAQNAISRHQFCQALEYLAEANKLGSNRYATELMLFDVFLESGNTKAAQKIIEIRANQGDFNYLIRMAKWKDHQGHLEEAILFLEKARAIAETSGQSHLKSWIYSNLGDFYGHHGDMKNSRDSYIMALRENPSDWYSLKSLAWMAWSNDGDDQLALKIVNRILEYHSSPSLKLLKSEILEYQGNKPGSHQLEREVFEDVSGMNYGAMYHKFLSEFYLNNGDLERASLIASREILERPVPQSYVLRMNVHLKQGEYAQAVKIARKEIIGQTFEPGVLLELLPINLHIQKELPGLIQDLQSAKYELGPLAIRRSNIEI